MLLPGWGRSYLAVRQNVARAPARPPHPNRGPGPSETTLRRASYARSVREARSPELAVKPQHCRTSDRRKHVQPSFHLRDDRADGSAAETTSIHHREAQAAAHLHQQRRLARREEISWPRASVFDLSVSGPPPATSEGPGPLRRKQKQNVFKRFSGLWALK